jgi:phage terminase large subunit-like protein
MCPVDRSMKHSLPPESIKILNDFTAMAQYKHTWISGQFLYCPKKICALFTGNQFGKTCVIIYSWILRFLSMHPIATKNFNYLRCTADPKHTASLAYKDKLIHRIGEETYFRCHKCKEKMEIYVSPFRKMRFASESLPGQGGVTGDTASGGSAIEARNTLYPELMKWIPKYMVKKDINSRSTVMQIRDIWGGPDILPEFVSYSQDTQAMAGVQLAGIAFDEEPPPAFFEEMRMRLLATNGTIDIGLTPANRLTYMHAAVYEHAAVYYRTKAVCDAFDLQPIEKTDSKKSIAVFQAATDDNPTLNPEAVARIMEDLDTDGDPDVLAIRRFGIFKAVSSTIFKMYSYQTHFLPMEKWFPHGIPDRWLHCRTIDYHPVNKWAIAYVSLSDTNEAFAWWEGNPDPSRLSTEEIAEILALAAQDLTFKIDRIDPLANVKTKKRTEDGARTTSVREDLNAELIRLKKAGIGTGGAFLGFDTKSTRGREQIKMRLKNALKCKEPFNNRVTDEYGIERNLPTLWIMDTCPLTAKSIRNWRTEEHVDRSALVTKDQKETPQQKWSHFCTAIEGIMKEAAFKPPVVYDRVDDRNRSSYFSRGGESALRHGVR